MFRPFTKINKLLLGKNSDYLLASEEMGPVDIRDDALAVCTNCKTLPQHYHPSAAAADRIGDRIKKMASEMHTKVTGDPNTMAMFPLAISQVYSYAACTPLP